MDFERMLSTILVAVIGLAIVAVLVSQRANTANVVRASGSSLASVIAAAVAPVTMTSNSPFGAANN